MRKIVVLTMAIALSTTVWGQLNITLKKGEESKKTDREMVANGYYLATVEGLDLWLTQSSEGAKGFEEDEDWQVVGVNDNLFPLVRRELKKTNHCKVLTVTTSDKWASALLVDSSERRETAILKAIVSLDSLKLRNGAVDTVRTFKYAKKDRCHVWGAVSANGEFAATLSVVEYKERKQYIAIASMYDAELEMLWEREYAVGTVDAIYVTDDGQLLTVGLEEQKKGNSRADKMTEEKIIISVIDKKGGDTYGITIQCERLKDFQIVNVVDNKMMCMGLFSPAESDEEDDLTGGVVAMSFSLDSLAMNGFTMRYFQNEDINILKNEKTKKIQKDRALPSVGPLNYVRTEDGAVVVASYKPVENNVNANGTYSGLYAIKGIHVVAFDADAKVKWVHNLRCNDVQEGSDDLLHPAVFMVDAGLCVVKSESRKEPEEYIISKDAREYEVGDKGNLVLYRFDDKGEVSKWVLEKKTKYSVGSAAVREDGTVLLMTVCDNKTRKVEMRVEETGDKE